MDRSYGGRFLRVNLSTGRLSAEPVPESVIRDFVGGRGFGSKYLYDEVPAGADPMGPENKLILLNGVLGGTNVQAVSRWQAITKSPLTGAVGKATGGADFGAWLKFAGFDLLILEGKADRPVYLYIERDKWEIKDASHLWGLDTEQTQNLLRETHGRNTRCACIGPAAENLVLFSVIASDRRTASRCGVGAVMASKNLKAVAINARHQMGLYDPAAFGKLVRWQIAQMKESQQRKSLSEHGTTYGAIRLEKMGLEPMKNFQEGRLTDIEKLSGDEFFKIKEGQFGCYSCMTRCGQIHRVKNGIYAGIRSEGPEYETIWALGSNLANTELGSTIAGDDLCDRLGLDTISTGVTIGFAFELYEKGIITKADTDGLELTWGNDRAMLALIERIARREGFGDVLAEGSKRAAERIGKGAEHYAMHTKGMELAAYEPRAAKGQGLSYAVSNVGGSVAYGYCRQEFFGFPIPRAVDRFANEGKGDVVAFNQKARCINEMAILCTHGELGIITPKVLAEMFVAATGIEDFGNEAYLNTVAERILAIERAFNVREGFSRKDDHLPQRMHTEPFRNAGPAEGQVCSNAEGLLDEYYQAVGYTYNGIPSAEKLKALGLSAIIGDMEKFY